MADNEKDEVRMHMLSAEEKPANEDTIDELTPNGNNKGDKPSPTKIDSADLEQIEIQAEEDDDDDDDADVQDTRPKGRNMFFKDGKRRIDYILAWKTTGKPLDLEESSKARAIFEKNLKKEGLHIEYDQRKGEEIYYAKIHAPWEVLTRYTEILKIKMPVKKTLVLDNIRKKYAKLEMTFYDDYNDDLFDDDDDGVVFEDEDAPNSSLCQFLNPMKAVSTRVWDTMTGFVRKLWAPFELDPATFPPIKHRFMLTFSREKEYLFDIPEEKELFFDNATRSRIVNFILRRKSFSDKHKEAFTFGVNKMIADNHYVAAYPLHEGHWKAGSAQNSRKRLFDNWSHWRNFFKMQPLNYIRQYYGEKIGLYFVWLGFYTQMLIPASIVGVIVFIYGCAIMNDSYPSKEICDPNTNVTMCPLCDFQCPYWNLVEACTHAKASRIFDNGGTVFFAIFMALWGTLFLEFWKRKQATMQFKWDLTDFVREEQPPRPEYLAKLEDVDSYKVHPITGLREPHLPFWRKRFPVFLLSWSVMFFMAALAIGAVVGVIAYRVSVLAALQIITRTRPETNSTFIAATNDAIYENAGMLTTVTAACINLLFIIILNMIYTRVAFWLTDMECLRTQKEYDDSITLKLFTLQFVNYYSSIVYIAFFKGRMVGRPGKYSTIFGARNEECEAGGCLIELCIQLAIIMTGKQLILNNITEIIMPKMIKLIKRCIWKETKEQKMAKNPWEKDFILEPAMNTSLFYEYLEMALQFGFLTLFVAAFPLGPLFAMLNNIIEIRTDALKFITHLRRPMAERTPDIGVWYSILYGISRIAIITNAFIIALTSDFVPRLVYSWYYSPDGTLTGYMNSSLSIFNTADFEENHRPAGQDSITECRYRDWRNGPSDPDKYEFSEKYWHILAARLAFVVVFENLIIFITGIIAWLIPDVPNKLKVQIRREAYISNEIIIKTELLRAQGDTIPEEFIDTIFEEESRRYVSDKYGSMEVVHRKAKGREETDDSPIV